MSTPTNNWRKRRTEHLFYAEMVRALYIVYARVQNNVNVNRSVSNHNLVLSSFMTYHWVWNKNNMSGATCGAGIAILPKQQLSSALVFNGVQVTRSLVFCDMFCRSLFVLLLLAVVLSILQFTTSDYIPLETSNF